MLPKEGRITLQTAAGAQGDGENLSVIGYGAAVLQVTGTFVGTVTFEASVDESTFAAIRVVNMSDGILSTTATAPGLYYVAAAGLRLVRARVSGWTSGAITVVGSHVAVGNSPIDQGAAVKFVDENGTAYGVQHIGNKIRTSSVLYNYDIAKGNVPGHTAEHAHGENPDVGTAWETVSTIATLMYYPPSVQTLIIKSDDTDDDGDPVGAGARTVEVNGLDAAWAVTTDTITLNGTTAVNFNVPMIRVRYAKVMTAGATGTNEGEITIYGDNGTSKILSIGGGEGLSRSATYSIPAGLTFYLANQFISDASLKGADIALFYREFGGIFHLHHGFQLLDSASPIPEAFPEAFLEKTDLEWRAKGQTAGAVVGVNFEGWTE